MFVPRSEERLLGARTHGASGLEELRICLGRSRPGGELKVEFRQWQKEEDGSQAPTRHGLRFDAVLVPWVIEILSKIPAESIDDRIKNLQKENSK